MEEANIDYNNIMSSSSSSSTMERENLLNFPMAGFLFVSITLMLLCIMCWQFIRKICSKLLCCFDDDDDDYYGNESSHSARQSIEADRRLAHALQIRLNEEACEEASELSKMMKRKERRMWYEYYLRPWTMTVQHSDLIHNTNHSKDDSSTQEAIDEDGTITVQTGSHGEKTNSFDSDDEEIVDEMEIEDGSVIAHLKLPSSVGNRCVDATCALCLEEYGVGEEVVWSSCRECPHAFHKECFMQWLSKGKKRCPICRHWFVPGQRIEDQKILHGASWTRALTEMEKREREETERKKQEEDQQQLEAGALPAAAAPASASAAEAATASGQQRSSSPSERRALESTMSSKSIGTYGSNEHES